MSRRPLALLLTLAALAAAFATHGTYAWFTDYAVSNQIYRIGDIQYVFSGSLAPDAGVQVVVPGQPLISSTNLYITNQSDIDTNLRLKIRFTYTDQITLLPVVQDYDGPGGALDDFMTVEMVGSWVWDASDTCWHFLFEGSPTIPASTTTEGYAFDILDGVSFNGDAIGVALSGAVFKLQFVYQAKQAGFVDWQTLGTQEMEALLD